MPQKKRSKRRESGPATTQVDGPEAKLVKRAKRLVRQFTKDTAKSSALLEAGRDRFEHEPDLGDLMAVGILSLHLKQVEEFEDLVDACRKLHAASASILSRPLLEDATTGVWIHAC